MSQEYAAHLEEKPTLLGPVARAEKAEAEIARLKGLLWESLEFAQHDSWRCAHPDRYPPNPDCRCGLLSFVARLEAAAGRPPEGWRPPPMNTWPEAPRPPEAI